MDPAATMLDVLQQTRFRVLFQSMNLRKPSLIDVAQHCCCFCSACLYWLVGIPTVTRTPIASLGNLILSCWNMGTGAPAGNRTQNRSLEGYCYIRLTTGASACCAVDCSEHVACNGAEWGSRNHNWKLLISCFTVKLTRHFGAPRRNRTIICWVRNSRSTVELFEHCWYRKWDSNPQNSHFEWDTYASSIIAAFILVLLAGFEPALLEV